MLKKVLLEKCIFTISLLLPCLCPNCIVTISLLPKLATIIEFSVIRFSSFDEKHFLPITLSRWIWGAPRKGLFGICKDFPWFSPWYDCVSYVIRNFFFRATHCHIFVTVLLFLLVWFSLGMVNSWYIPKRSIFCNTFWSYCFTLEVILFHQYRKSNSFTQIWIVSSSACFASSRIFPNFASGPITSRFIFSFLKAFLDFTY